MCDKRFLQVFLWYDIVWFQNKVFIDMFILFNHLILGHKKYLLANLANKRFLNYNEYILRNVNFWKRNFCNLLMLKIHRAWSCSLFLGLDVCMLIASRFRFRCSIPSIPWPIITTTTCHMWNPSTVRTSITKRNSLLQSSELLEIDSHRSPQKEKLFWANTRIATILIAWYFFWNRSTAATICNSRWKCQQNECWPKFHRSHELCTRFFIYVEKIFGILVVLSSQFWIVVHFVKYFS